MKPSLTRRFLQVVRDEAHRFANRYNADLRSKKIRESVLEDFRGLGEKKDLPCFPIWIDCKIKKARVEDFEKVEGIGKKTAIELVRFLDNLSTVRDEK